MLADIIVIFVILLCIFLGYRKGLIKVAVRILSFIAALIVALILYTPISNYVIENTEIVPNLTETISTKLYHKDEKEETKENESLTETMENYINDYTDGIKENTTGFIAEEIAIAVVRIVTWIALFIIVKILMLFIRLFTDAIAEIPIIKQFNKARGNNIWGIRRLFNNLCSFSSFKCYISYDGRK